MKREIVDAALFQQFMKYMIEKKANESKTTQTYTDSGKCNNIFKSKLLLFIKRTYLFI